MQPSAPSDALVLDGRYVLGESLGRGGMAEVFRARDTVLDRDVAVKVFTRSSALPDGDVRRAGEVRLLAGLSHPNLVTVFDAGRDTTDPADPFAYLVMELVPGRTLAQTVAGGPLAATQVADIGAQLAAALAYVHERGVVHRDVKPANVLLNSAEPGGRVTAKLTDFGVARLLDSTRLTVEGTTLGTANYLSPEQATGGEITGASDVYSLGLVLFEALTGEVAYPGTGIEAAVARLHRQPAVPDWIEPGWRTLLADMTARDPADRPDAAVVEARLRRLRRDTAPIAVFARPVTPRSSRRTLWTAGGLALAAAVLAVVIGVTTGPDSSAGTPTRAYPHVVGTLGSKLSTLESAVPAALNDDTYAVATAAAGNRFAQSQRALAALAADLSTLHNDGVLSDADFARATAAIGPVQGALRTALRSAAHARAAAQSRSAARQARAEASAKARKHAQRHARQQARQQARQAADSSPNTSAAAPPPTLHGPPAPHVPPGQAKKAKKAKKGPGPPPGHGHGHGPGPG